MNDQEILSLLQGLTDVERKLLLDSIKFLRNEPQLTIYLQGNEVVIRWPEGMIPDGRTVESVSTILRNAQKKASPVREHEEGTRNRVRI